MQILSMAVKQRPNVLFRKPNRTKYTLLVSAMPRALPDHMHCLSASPWPWKKRKDRKKSATKMATNDMTTADVVDSPTPFAPPVVVNPQEQLTWRRCAPCAAEGLH
jgi:hypothetical protein